MQTKRHAILLAVHRLPELVHRLAERLVHPRIDLYLHVDSKFDMLPFQSPLLRPVARRYNVVWNGFGLVSLTLDWMRDIHPSNTYASYTYLSGQDYPIRPVDEIVRAFDSGQDLFIDMQWSGDVARESRWNRFHVTDPRPLVRWIDKFRRRLVPGNRGVRSLPLGLSEGCGSALWTLSHPAVEWMLKYLAERPEVEKFFRNTLHSDEFFYQTVLSASPFAGKLGQHAHFIDWSAGEPHPAMLRMEHFDLIRASEKLFARKFDPVVSRELLDTIDSRILSYSQS